VTVSFQLPCLRHNYRNKPEHYISHLVGHEGPGSLLSALKVITQESDRLVHVETVQCTVYWVHKPGRETTNTVCNGAVAQPRGSCCKLCQRTGVCCCLFGRLSAAPSCAHNRHVSVQKVTLVHGTADV
jgi:hypothetical protein